MKSPHDHRVFVKQRGGSKEAWVAGMFRDIVKYDRIKVAVWWDGCDGMPR
jgi:hypothetical protein